MAVDQSKMEVDQQPLQQIYEVNSDSSEEEKMEIDKDEQWKFPDKPYEVRIMPQDEFYEEKQ